MTSYKVKVTLTEPMLGSAPPDPEVYQNFIAARRIKLAPKALVPELEKNQEEVTKEELGMLPETTESGITVFRRKEGHLVMMDFQIRGFIKEAAESISGTWGIRSKIDKWLFVKQRTIPILRNGKFVDAPDSKLDRPLRALTMMGPRVALASSELIDAGVTLEFDIIVLPLGEKGGVKGTDKTKFDEETIKSWLDYGQYNGLGQWRTGSYGRFTYEFLQAKRSAAA